MTRVTTSAFNLSPKLAAKAEPARIAEDERHFAAIAETLERDIADLTARRDEQLRAPGVKGQAALERDLEIHRLSARLRLMRRFGLDLCLGRMVRADDGKPIYIGRLGLSDGAGDPLLVDWRAPAAEPFFGATYADPMGLASRRRYRWTLGRISDYWDEAFTQDGLDTVALDDDSAFIASLGSSRSPKMRDVLSTIQADQDAIIRAGSRGALVVDGGPGTGKTVVALHRAAYLLYADPRLRGDRGGVLFVGPHQPYMAYIADVLPGLGEEGVQTCTLRDLVAEGPGALPEIDAEVAGLKATTEMIAAIETAVRLSERPPSDLLIETDWFDMQVEAEDWAEAFEARDAGTAHNEARDAIWEALLEILIDKHDQDTPPELLRRALLQSDELAGALNRAWPLIDPAGLVASFWSVPSFLRHCAPWLTDEQVQLLQRADPRAWTVADLPLLDAAWQLIGDPTASRRRRDRAEALAAQQEAMSMVVDNLIAADDDGEGLVTMLRVEDARHSLIDESALPSSDSDALAGPFAHIVVDEAQELTDAEWQMLLTRCPSRSFTIVGDRAQARHGFTESWEDRLQRVGFKHVNHTSLSVNYRTPEEIMVQAEPVIRAELPDANVPTSIRSSGIPVVRAEASDLESILGRWLDEHTDGTACVIGDPAFEGTARVRSLSPAEAKGLEFDLVIVVHPDAFGTGIEGAVDRYVAMTRATQQLVILG